ncbi:MAG: chlorophyll synthesis pathway protein BchC [Steroidobacteraceae bacterium]
MDDSVPAAHTSDERAFDGPGSDALAVVLEQPGKLVLSRVPLSAPTEADIVVEIHWTGISTGTERLLWNGRMPSFPGMGYPLVPGYESVGCVVAAGPDSGHQVGSTVFVPGANCFGRVRGLFGGAASRLVVPGRRAQVVADHLGEQAVLLALAATAQHAISAQGGRLPELIVGHGVLGRLLARLTVLAGAPPPVVWENDPVRAKGAAGYNVIDPADDARRNYSSIYDVSGDPTLLDRLFARLAHGGEVVLAGFYSAPLQFSFPTAFMREARLRVAAEWQEADLTTVRDLAASRQLSLDGLITHRRPWQEAQDAYQAAFEDPTCLKMILDWRTCS